MSYNYNGNFVKNEGNSPSGIINGPYKQPIFNYGQGPQIYGSINELMNTDVQTLISDPILRKPTNDNPMMNVMPLDYDTEQLFSDNYNNQVFDYNRETMGINKSMKNNFENGLYQDADSILWDRQNSQRQFFTNPVGSVPSHQNEFANWLYSNDNNCKSGSIYMKRGVQYTDDSLMCNGYNVSVPTNFGLLNGNLMSSVYQNN